MFTSTDRTPTKNMIMRALFSSLPRADCARFPSPAMLGAGASYMVGASARPASAGTSAAAMGMAASPSTDCLQRGHMPSARRECLSPHPGQLIQSAMIPSPRDGSLG